MTTKRDLSLQSVIADIVHEFSGPAEQIRSLKASLASARERNKALQDEVKLLKSNGHVYCGPCGTQVDALWYTRHLQTRHLVSFGIPVSDGDGDWYECPECHKRFASEKSCAQHMRAKYHLDDRLSSVYLSS